MERRRRARGGAHFKARKSRLKELNNELQPILVDVDALMNDVQSELQSR